MIERKVTSRGGASSIRSSFACVLIVLLVLQGLAAIGSSVASARDHGPTGVVASLFGVTCATATANSDSTPSNEHQSRQCCVLCTARDLDAVVNSAATAALETSVLQTGFTTGGLSAEPCAGPPTGWGSSWSSQAPPVFS